MYVYVSMYVIFACLIASGWKQNTVLRVKCVHCRSSSNLADMQGSGILGTTAGEEVGLSGLPDRSSVVQLLDIGHFL